MYEPTPLYEPRGDQPNGDQPNGAPTGTCKCDKWEPREPEGGQPIRRLLLALKVAVKEAVDKGELPLDAIKKFDDELKDPDKEAQGILAVYNAYKKFYEQVDCQLAKAKAWKEKIAEWLKGNIDSTAEKAIRKFRKDHYDDIENRICCDWLVLRHQLNCMRDCLEQAKRTEEESKQDYDGFKGFEKTLGERFTLLESLFKQAEKLNEEERYQALFAVSLEFDEVYNNLGLVRDWAYAREQCPKLPQNGECGETEPSTPEDGYGEQSPPPGGDQYAQTEPQTPESVYGEQSPPPPEEGGSGQEEEGLKTKWPPDVFRTKLTGYLREFILARYQRFRWQQEFLKKTADTEAGGKECQDFRKDRQQQFIDEADDIVPTNGGGGGGGEYGEQPTGGYTEKTPTGSYTEEPPTSGDYQQKPPAGNYPDRSIPPSSDYEDTPAPPRDTYQGRTKK